MRKKLNKRNVQFSKEPSKKSNTIKGSLKHLTTYKQKLFMVGIICSLILVGVAITYAFIQISMTTKNQEASITTGTLALTFEDGTASFQGELEFGGSAVKTFTIENTGTVDASAVMYFDNLINTYTLGSLTYRLEYSETQDGEYIEVVSSTNVPRSEEAVSRILSSSLMIPSKQKYFYKLTMTLNYLEDVDQTADLNAIFSSTFRLEEKGNKALDTVYALGLKAKEGKPDFSQASTSDETRDGLYSMEDDYGTSYYFRGAVENNYVKFAGFYWRIIRINGDGSLRIQYDGTIAHANGESNTDRSPIHSTQFNPSGDAKYLGYMYSPAGTTVSTSKEQAQTNDVDSTAKIALDNWYESNIENKGYTKYLSDTLFCNDRLTNDTPSAWYSWDTTLGYGKNGTVYEPERRMLLNSPKLICNQQNDRFTIKDTDIGNGTLKYPVGLITLDEIMIAGSGSYSTANQNYYLYKGHAYWSMSPTDLYYSNASPDIQYVNSNGSLYGSGGSSSSRSISPVINIKPEYASQMIGNGTMTTPYQIEETIFNVPEAVKTIKNNKTPKAVKEGNPNFAEVAITDEGVYAMEDDYGTSYYFRGAVENNYVKFAGFYWRIVRINGDGSLRIQYDGTIAHANGESNADRVALTNIEWNSGISPYDAKYVGYMYGETSNSYQEAVKNDINSTIKERIDSWYENNLLEYTKYIADEIFCNDREIETDLINNNSGTYKEYTTLGYGNNSTLYKAASRVGADVPNPKPSFKCTQKNDAFTINQEKGNGMLTYPVGMITIDEVNAAGRGLYKNSPNNSYYLYKGITYWTMSPHNHWSGGYPYMARSEDNSYKIISNAVSPVINIKPEYASSMLGTGYMDDPYRLDTPEEREEYEKEQKRKENVQKVLTKLNITAKNGNPTFTSQATTDEGVYSMEDDYGTSYYYRGTPTNNYVKFGDFYWRILRINGDGTLRIVYDGTTAHTNGESSLDRVAVQNIKYNTNTNDAKFNGYMYSPSGTTASTSKEQAETNVESSTIKIELDKWYEDNIIANHLETYLADSVFCNDRTLEDTGLGYGTNYTLYAGRGRYRGTWAGKPTLKCLQKNDAFTANDTKYGNGDLKYPIGLLTKDEDLAAGTGTSKNTKYYLYKGYQYWTMTPDSYTSCANIMPGNSWTNYNCSNIASTHLVPVINLKVDTILSMTGEGSKDSPYQL